jgi:hypothetical protein
MTGDPYSAPFDAYHLPAGTGQGPMETVEAGVLIGRFPAPTADLVRGAVAGLAEAGEALAERPVASIVDALDAAATRLADPGGPLREEAHRLLSAATGYSPAMARLVLDRMAADWRASALNALLAAEFGDPAAVDRFVPRPGGGRVRAYGARLAFHVFAGNVPGVAVTSMIRSLLVKTPVLGKLAVGEPVLPVLFARALAGVDEELGRALAVTYWPGGGARDAVGAALDAAELVVVYGGEAVVRALRERAPVSTRLVVHGPRFSAGLVTAGALDGDTDDLARSVAWAVATFDQHGCVSPHAVWVEDPEGSRVGPFAEKVARALADVERELPRGLVSPAEAAAIQRERGAAELRGHAGAQVRVLAAEGTAWTVVVDPDPAFRPSCLNRFLRLHPVPDLDAAVTALEAAGAWLQSVAVAAPQDQLDALAHRLAAAGATRVTTFHRIPWPPPHWHHDGSGPLMELVRWVDLEA